MKPIVIVQERNYHNFEYIQTMLKNFGETYEYEEVYGYPYQAVFYKKKTKRVKDLIEKLSKENE